MSIGLNVRIVFQIDVVLQTRDASERTAQGQAPGGDDEAAGQNDEAARAGPGSRSQPVMAPGPGSLGARPIGSSCETSAAA